MMCIKFNCFYAGELLKNVASVIGKWKKLLKYYMPSLDEEVGTWKSWTFYWVIISVILPVIMDEHNLEHSKVKPYLASFAIIMCCRRICLLCPPLLIFYNILEMLISLDELKAQSNVYCFGLIYWKQNCQVAIEVWIILMFIYHLTTNFIFLWILNNCIYFL